MYLMSKQDVLTKIDEINKFLSDFLWMDFEFAMLNGNKAVLAGAIDLSYNRYNIDIEFEQPHFISTLFLFQTDPQKDKIIELVEDCSDLNRKYQVEQGNYIFKINAEDFENTPIYIGAKKIDYILYNH